MKRLFVIPTLFLGLLVAGCDSNDTKDGETMITLRLQPMVNGSQMLSDETKTYDINGSTATFTSARLYISQIVLHAEDGSNIKLEADPITVPAKDAADNTIQHTVTDKIVLVKSDTGTEEYYLGTVPSGRYTGMSFKVGIQGIDNRVDPSQVPAGHPLAKQTDKNNHWSWSAGYQYIRMDGLVDTDGDGTGDEVWETHLGTENFLTHLDLSLDFTLTEDEATLLHVMADFGKLMADVDLSDPEQRLCHTADNLPVAQKVGANVASAFMLHGVHLDEDHQ